MSNTSLGLDLGPASIGWALIEETNQVIVAAGVRIFPEGVDRDQQGGEQSKSQSRREARAGRRQIARRARRKRQLRDLLADAGLLPVDASALESVLAANPYPLRRRALEERLTPHEIGRVLVHLGQRRGFLSNRKTDKAKDKDTKGMLGEISELASAIQRDACRTLGQYLANVEEAFDHGTAADNQTVRRRHTRRDMYEHEFETIWEAQRAYYRELLVDELKERVRRIIFFQREMYWPKSVVGRCELEPKCKRCPRADRSAQRFRILQEINNLRMLDCTTLKERFLTGEERAKLVAYLCTGRQRTFDQIRKKLGLTESVHFNLERGERDKLKGHETDALLSSKKGIGKRWNGLSDAAKDAVLAVLIEEEREDRALRRLVEDCGLSQEEGGRALTVNLPDGYMNFSREAIVKLLPHLERGLLLMGDDPTNSALHAAGYLRPDEREPNQRNYLPPSPDLPNPIVRQALIEVRKVVNAVIREYGRPDRIHVELAREAKKSFDQRREIRFENARRRRAREDAKARIAEYDSQMKLTRRTVDRYLLWKEQEEFCPYCGRKMGLAQLFNGDTDIDHILPRWRSLDDSLANKVVSHRACNEAKGDQTPREWLEDSDPQRYEQVLRVAERLPYSKQRKFQQRDIVLDHFVERQLRDTAYISRCVTQYLRCLGATIVCPRGQMTADLRHWWGLNTILDPEGRGEKNRADHRHHAIDAIVLALTDHKRLHALANARGRNMPAPWEGFRGGVQGAVDGINVSHRAQRGLAGALHEATMYGATQKATAGVGLQGDEDRPWAKGWIEDEDTYVRRKPVTALTSTRHLDKVRDSTIREILRTHLRNRGIDPDTPGRIPGDAFKGENAPRMASGVPVKRVRMLEESETFRRVSDRRSFQYVKPGNNHHIVYWAAGAGDHEKWTAEVVTMWDAALRARNGQHVVDRSDRKGRRFVMSLCLGEMFQIDGDEGRPLLCVLRKLDQRSKRVHYKVHTDARESAEINKDNLYLSPENLRKRGGRKVIVDPIGRIRRAND